MLIFHWMFFVDHELRAGYVRLKLIIRERLDLLWIHGTTRMNVNGLCCDIPTKQMLSDEQKDALRQIYNLYETDNQLRNENAIKFMEMFNSYNTLRKVTDWWNSINFAFSITSVGKVLAHANAQKCSTELPPLD